jgi:hypothetical protein
MAVAQRIKGYDWLAGFFYPLSVILMETFWVYPWLVWAGGWSVFAESRPLLGLGTVILVLALALLTTRLLLKAPWRLRYVRSAIIGGGVVVILLVLGYEYADGYTFLSGAWFAHVGRLLGETLSRGHTIALALPVLVYLWWRGIVFGSTTAYFRNIYRSFLVGVVALVLLIIFWRLDAGADTARGPGAAVGLQVMAFFFFGLISVALCHLYLMRRSMPEEEAGRTSVWRWLPMMLGVIGGMIVVGFGVASIFTTDFFAAVGRGVQAVGAFLGRIVDYIVVPFNWLLEKLIYLWQLFISWISSDQEVSTEPPGGFQSPFEGQEEVTGTVPPVATEVLKWLVIIAIVALVIFILAKAISRLRARRAQEDIEEIHESLWSESNLRDDLRQFFGRFGQWFRRRPAPAVYRFDDADGRLDVREIYRRMQWEAARAGTARRRQETASEYAGRLGRAVPEGRGPIKRITELYSRVRYGETGVREKQLDSANGLWVRLRGLLRGRS